MARFSGVQAEAVVLVRDVPEQAPPQPPIEVPEVQTLGPALEVPSRVQPLQALAPLDPAHHHLDPERSSARVSPAGRRTTTRPSCCSAVTVFRRRGLRTISTFMGGSILRTPSDKGKAQVRGVPWWGDRPAGGRPLVLDVQVVVDLLSGGLSALHLHELHQVARDLELAKLM